MAHGGLFTFVLPACPPPLQPRSPMWLVIQTINGPCLCFLFPQSYSYFGDPSVSKSLLSLQMSKLYVHFFFLPCVVSFFFFFPVTHRGFLFFLQVVILDVRVPCTPVARLNNHRACVNGIAWAPHSSCHICTAGNYWRGVMGRITGGG